MQRKRIVYGALICLSILSLSSCGSGSSMKDKNLQGSSEMTTQELDEKVSSAIEDINKKADQEMEEDEVVDLTTMSSTFVYAEVYTMMRAPEEYMGKTIKMKGTLYTFENPATGIVYHACIIKDATACCSQGIEFITTDDFVYPRDYPAEDEEVTVTGVFETYEEDGNFYARLRDATLEF